MPLPPQNSVANKAGGEYFVENSNNNNNHNITVVNVHRLLILYAVVL